MKIKRLQIQGFKSFVDRVDMSFPDGIIAVVGPNGCGKSNIVDAIRWVLGEQSAKHLRGKLMEDIIFNGSETRKPVGMAEVSLTFDNGDGRAPAEYADYSEIMVSRRLFRSGESEYYINKAPCRLKDITELFMDTGVGTKAYSIVEQGKIGAIVTMKPEERRTLIEEAAGITKYKSRKNAALRRVDATEQNLLRVRDVIREVKRQINSLERQAKKARRFKELRERIRVLEISLSAVNYRRMEAELKGEVGTLRSNVDREAAICADIAKRDRELEEGRLMASEAEESLREEQEKVHHTSKRIVAYEQRISFNEQELKRLKDEEIRYGGEVELLNAQLKELDSRAGKLRFELEELSGREAEESSNLKEMEVNYEGLAGSFEEREMGLEKAKGELVHIVTMKSNLQNSIVHLNGRVEDIEARLGRKMSEKERAVRMLEKVKERQAEFDSRLEGLYRERSSIDGSKSAEAERLKTLREDAGCKEEEVRRLQEEIHRQTSRLQSLKELKLNYEGAKAGVRSVMRRHSESPLTDGIVGIVADFLDVPKEYEVIAGAVLDQRLQDIVVENRSRGIEAVEYLKKNSAGRGTFIWSDGAGFPEGSGRSASSWKGSGIPLRSKILAREGFEWLLDRLLDDVLLVADIDEGLGVRSAGFRGTVVTGDGDIIEPTGGITGGRGEGGGVDLLKREREIKEISKALKISENDYRRAYHERLKLLEEIDLAEKGLDDLKQREFSKGIEIANLEKDRAGVSKEVKRESERLNIISMEEEQLRNDMEGFRKEIVSSEEKLSSYGEEEGKREAEIKSTQVELVSIKESLEKARHDLTELRIRSASIREKRENLEKEIKGLEGSREEAFRRLERDEILLSEGRENAKRVAGEIEADGKTLAEMMKHEEELRSGLNERKNTYESLAGEISKAEAELKDLRRAHNEIREEISRMELSVTRKEMEIRHLVDGIEDKYEVNLVHEIGNIPEPEEGDEERLGSLRKNVEDMGEVNLTALEEHRENLERLTFLEEQERDLVEAIGSLKKAISRINRTSRKRFKEAFDAIDEKFQELFPALFRGGKAQLVLTDENDLLETGVDIIAQPPGKKLQNMNLLSGGEKALTAITLIFSMFLVKPSPFCLLDEVDAPLDDSNVDRFNNLVRQMSDMSQIIMITHNKHSIEIGNTLYGITMEDPGVSRLVSVKLN